MLIRLVLSLTLLLPQLALPLMTGAAPHAGSCEEAGCCGETEVVTCCGTTVVERFCRHSGGPCRCGVQQDDPERGPRSTPPRDGREIGPQFAGLLLPAVGVDVLRAPRRTPRPAGTAELRTRHETRALLCIWQT